MITLPLAPAWDFFDCLNHTKSPTTSKSTKAPAPPTTPPIMPFLFEPPASFILV